MTEHIFAAHSPGAIFHVLSGAWSEDKDDRSKTVNELVSNFLYVAPFLNRTRKWHILHFLPLPCKN